MIVWQSHYSLKSGCPTSKSRYVVSHNEFTTWEGLKIWGCLWKLSVISQKVICEIQSETGETSSLNACIAWHITRCSWVSRGLYQPNEILEDLDMVQKIMKRVSWCVSREVWNIEHLEQWFHKKCCSYMWYEIIWVSYSGILSTTMHLVQQKWQQMSMIPGRSSEVKSDTAWIQSGVDQNGRNARWTWWEWKGVGSLSWGLRVSRVCRKLQGSEHDARIRKSFMIIIKEVDV